jgi:hypothetical protein
MALCCEGKETRINVGTKRGKRKGRRNDERK